MSRFTELFQKPTQTVAPEPSPKPVKVAELVDEKPVVAPKSVNKKFSIN